jgi:hypothetical protein
MKSSSRCAALNIQAARFAAVSLMALALLSTGLAAEKGTSKDKFDPARVIQYRGGMPMLKKNLWGTDVAIRFELYRSPTGGAPFWSESRPVAVRQDGWVKVDLGEVEPLPDEAFTTSFRFLSIWHGETEFIPRKQIASLAYVAAKDEMNVPLADYKEYAVNELLSVKKAAAMARGPVNELGAMVPCGTFGMEKYPRMPAPWLKAMETAARLGGRLPTFEEWYGAYDGKPSAELVAMAGHYEWVMPWVYEPSIHGRFQELYRGKPAACYYNELNPLNDYPFRLVLDDAASKP